MTWLLLSVMLAAVYSSNLTSSLTVHEQPMPFTSMAQLISQDVYSWGIQGGSSQESLLKARS